MKYAMQHENEEPAEPADRGSIPDEQTARPVVLVADDDPIARRVARECLTSEGYEFVEASNGVEAVDRMHDGVFVVLLDINMPGMSGFDCLRTINSGYPDSHVIMITSSDDTTDAVRAIKAGASEYVLKPLTADSLITHVRNAVQSSQLARDNRELRHAVSHTLPTSVVSPRSASYDHVLEQAQRVAQTESTTLITGESGTGKSTLARMIHQLGPRAKGPFISVNCASLPRELIEAELFGHDKDAYAGAPISRPGRVEIADGGTLFLDEIGSLPLDLQPKLLTFLQERMYQRIGSQRERYVDVRLIAATNQDLAQLAAAQHFRPDLQYRLSALSLHVPPIRERIDDIVSMAQEIVARLAKKMGREQPGISALAAEKMRVYNWPGNIREMENVLERAMTFNPRNPEIAAEDLDLAASPAQHTASNHGTQLAGMTMAEIEKLALIQTLAAFDGNKAMSARQLGISEKSIYNKLKRHGLFEGKKRP